MPDSVKPRRVRMVDLSNPFASLEGMTELLLLRHGEQQLAANMPVGEVLDAPLSAQGREQARALGERLAGTALDAVWCSPLGRARETARAVAAPHGLEPVVHEGLREIDQFRGVPDHLGVIDHYGEERFVALMREANRTRRYATWPDSEDVGAFRRRVVAAVRDIAAANEGRRVAVACHAGVINNFLAEALDSRVDQVLPLHHTSITTVRVAGDRQAVLTVNDFAHVHAVQTARNDLNG